VFVFAAGFLGEPFIPSNLNTIGEISEMIGKEVFGGENK
jgi:hypothetical protein